MNIEDAIEIILVNRGCVELDISNGEGRLSSEMFVDACGIAISSMERDISREVKFVPDDAVSGVYCCSNCDTVIFYKSNYCNDCGQKLKWGE